MLTAVRNGARFLAETIDSIRAQTFRDWEYIIVDDASEDETPEIVRGYEQCDGRIRLLRIETVAGPYGAANAGLRHARGHYIARIDGDDVARPQRLDRQLTFLRSNPRLRASASFWQVVSEDGAIEPLVRKVPQSPRVVPWFLCVKSGFVHSSAFVERQALEEIGAYRELPVSQDYRMWCDLAAREWLGVVPEVLVLWRAHRSSIGARSYTDQVRAHIEILRDHMSELTGERWSLEDASALFEVSRAREIGLLAGLDVLDRWESAWRITARLTRGERHELSRLALRLRLRHVKWNGRREPLRMPAAAARAFLGRTSYVGRRMRSLAARGPYD